MKRNRKAIPNAENIVLFSILVIVISFIYFIGYSQASSDYQTIIIKSGYQVVTIRKLQWPQGRNEYHIVKIGSEEFEMMKKMSKVIQE